MFTPADFHSDGCIDRLWYHLKHIHHVYRVHACINTGATSQRKAAFQDVYFAGAAPFRGDIYAAARARALQRSGTGIHRTATQAKCTARLVTEELSARAEKYSAGHQQTVQKNMCNFQSTSLFCMFFSKITLCLFLYATLFKKG